MKILGINFDADRLSFAVVTQEEGGEPVLHASGRLLIGNTRDAVAVREFARAVTDLVDGAAPDRIAVKGKVETGQMGAGPASLKMEAIVVVSSSCPVVFPTPQALKKIDDADGLFAYLQDAYKAAICGFTADTSPKPKKKAKPKTVKS